MEKLLVVLFIIYFAQAIVQPVDQTLLSGFSGGNVVRAVLSKLDASRIFEHSGNSDLTNIFMRRMAYVETRDGTEYSQGNSEGGIWKISRTKFEQTQRLSDSAEVYAAITTYLGLDWRRLDYGELTKPLYSGLAVRLYLMHIGVNIPLTPMHASFWIEHFKFNIEGLVDRWLRAIENLTESEGKLMRLTMLIQNTL